MKTRFGYVSNSSSSSFCIVGVVADESSLADQFSENIGITKSITAVLHIALSLILFFWIQKNKLGEKYGFCRLSIPAKRFLFYIPLIIIASTAFWGGIKLKL